MKAAHLESRALLRIDGGEAVEFLQNLVTCDIGALEEGMMSFGALLTPQGKILFDFFCLRTESGFLFDIDATMRADFIKRMMFYRLRTPVEIAAVDDGRKVFALWDGAEGGVFDPRLGDMGQRLIGLDEETSADEEAFHRHRIALGMPQGGIDYAFGEAFPHDAMMDQFGDAGAGVAFDKGCYVGQEVVSRMQHRGTARKRVMQVRSKAPLPASTTAIEAGGKAIGTLGSVAGTSGLAMVRTDRVSAAAGTLIKAGDVEIALAFPAWTSLEGGAS